MYYIQKRSKSYYFRIAVPLDLRSHFPVREIKKSLGMISQRQAQALAGQLALDTLNTFDRVRAGISMAKGDFGLVTIYSGTSKIVIDRSDAAEEALIAEAYARGSAATPPTASKTDTPDAITLSELIEKYIAEKLREGSWRPLTEAGNRAKLNLLLEIIGDIPAGSVTAANARAFKEVLQQLPSNFKKASLYEGMSIEEITATTPVKSLSNKTINEYLTVASGVIDWGKRQSYISGENYFKGMKLRAPGLAREAVEPYTDTELTLIFSDQDELLHPYQYWIPIIGLYSGMRLEEIAQLHVKDIKQMDTIWVLSIDNDEPDKGIKSDHSRRKLPMHSELIRLGLLEFVEQQRADGKERLFPELTKIGGRYGKTVSSWFSERKKKLGLGKTKNFHSLRHTFTNRLKQKGVVEGMTDELTGHATDGISYSRYAERYAVETLQTTIEGLSFDIPVAHFSSYKFRKLTKK